MRFKCIVNHKEVRNCKTGTRRYTLERRETAKTNAQLESKVKRKFNTATATRKPVDRIFPNALAFSIGIQIQVSRFAMEQACTLPIEIELALQVFHR